MSSFRATWRRFCYGGEGPIGSYPHWDYVLRTYGYLAPIHVPLAGIAAAIAWWLR